MEQTWKKQSTKPTSTGARRISEISTVWFCYELLNVTPLKKYRPYTPENERMFPKKGPFEKERIVFQGAKCRFSEK